MGQVPHGSATTTEAVRRAIQNSQASLRALSRRTWSPALNLGAGIVACCRFCGRSVKLIRPFFRTRPG
jgi:hypothetical protein